MELSMKKHWFIGLSLLMLASLAAGQTAAQSDSLEVHLQAFKPYLDKTWKGSFSAEPGQPQMHDVSRWERMLNGQAIRMMHSVNLGEYGGETILFWDRAKQSLVYYYFTTAGFFTNGTMTLKGNKWISHEYVTNNANGITEVRSTSEFLTDGSLHTVAEFLKDGKWIHGHTIHYVPSPESQVIFR